MFIIGIYDTVRSNKVGHLKQLKSVINIFGDKDSYIINLSKENKNGFLTNCFNVLFKNLYLGKFIQNLHKTKSPPDFIITIGHRTVVYGFLLKHYYSKIFRKKIKHVHIFAPSVVKTLFCDVIVSPFPVKKFFANKVIEIDGTPSFVKYENLTKFKEDKVVSVFLGDEAFLRTKQDVWHLITHLKKIDKNYIIKIITSRRTKKSFATNLKQELLPNMQLYEFGVGENVFASAMMESSAYIISADSISMISEVLSIAKDKAVYIYGLQRLKSRKSFKYATKVVQKAWVLELEKFSQFTTFNKRTKFDVLAQISQIIKK